MRPAAGWILPRPLHPGAWWLWALGMATAASRTTNPLLLAVLVAVAGFVVASRRSDAPWARAYVVFLRFGLITVALRVAFFAVFGAPTGDHQLVALPQVTLPHWMVGVRLGGPVTVEGVLAAAYDGLRLATMLVCVGAANSLASPVRLVRALPGALYEAGVAVVVAFSLVPQSLVVVRRIRAARRLRGLPDRGLRALRGMALPVLEEALERSVSLAASMDSRGYGRRAAVPGALRYATGALTLGGLLGLCVGVYGLLDGTTPAVLGGPALAAGVALAVAGLVLGGRRVVRTRYRPDHWRAPELVAVAAGVLVAACFAAAPATGMHPPTAPLAWPPLPVLPVLGALVAAAPALLTPPAPRTVLA